MTDPASADDYDEKVRVAKDKRMELEMELGTLTDKIGDN